MNCVICLCVFNNEFGLPFVLNNILTIGELFSKIQILVFYDKSTDSSLEILEKYKEKHRNIEIIVNEKERTVVRTENISIARNSLLQTIREKYSDYSYFIMMDSNEYSCIGNINIKILEKMLRRKEEWDAISFDREAGYYDTWALSFDPFVYSFFHCEQWNRVVDLMRTSFKNLLEDYKKNKPEQLIPVYSAFNGFSLYKMEKFINCLYNSNIDIKLFPKETVQKQMQTIQTKIIPRFTNDCEHRHFHLEAIKKNGAKIRICTDFLFAKFIDPPKGLRGPA